MLVPKKNRLAVYSALFKDGVLCAKKDVTLPKHHEIEVPNLHVIKLLESLKSRGFVNLQFNWQWYFWILTDDGINHLREYLHLPSDIVPNSLKKSNKPQTLPSFRQEEDSFRGGRGGRGGRSDYRGPRDNAEGGESRGFSGRGRGGRGRGRGGHSQE